MNIKTFALLAGLIVPLLYINALGEQQTEFTAVYSDGKKVGYNKTTYDNSGETLIIKEHSNLNMILLGTKNHMEINTKYVLQNEMLSEFEFEMKSVGLDMRAKGKRDGNKLVFTTQTVSGESEFEKPVEHEPVVASYLHKWVAARGFEAGKKYTVHIFEPSMLLMGSDINDLVAEIEIVGKYKIQIPSGTYDTYKYTMKFNDSVSNIWINENGELVKDVSSLGLVALREEEREMSIDSLDVVDLTGMTAISANKQIDAPRQLNKLEVKLSGLHTLSDYNLNDNYRQFLSEDLLLIKREDINRFKYIDSMPEIDEGMEQYLRHTNLIQSRNKIIVTLAKNIIGKTENPMDKVKLLNSWTYNSIDKKPTISIPNALDVLKTKTGDCNEHAVLFAALSRSVGIPTKIILGIVYLDGKFYYHAWNEVFLGGWVSVDATLNQLPADASHIKFFEGDISRSAEIMKLVGKLDLQIIDAS